MNRTELPTQRLPRREPLIKRIARVLMPVVVATTTIQPLAYAAPNPSLLSQQPRFVDVAVDSNVAFIMDDSLSMEDIRLPVPAALNPGESTGGTVTIRGAATGFVSGAFTVGSAIGNIDRSNEWIYRSSTLNPLYYNPAITYTPWNDNGRAGLSGVFGPAKVGTPAEITAGRSDDFRVGLTPHDMRYVGPNYAYGVNNNFNRRLTTTGANPPAVPAFLTATRPVNGGFSGVTDAAATPANQDLFTSPMVLANGGPLQCTTTPTNPLLSALPSATRGSQAQPTTSRGTTARPATPQPTATRSTVARDSQSRPATNRTTSTRPSTAPTTAAAATSVRNQTALTITNRAITTRPNSALPATTNRTTQGRPFSALPATTNRTTSARPSTPVEATTSRTTSARPSTPQLATNRDTQSRPNYTPPATTNRTTSTRPSTALTAPLDRTISTRPTQYRQEQGVCGNFGAWVSSPPAPAFCSDPNSEGGVRVAIIQTQPGACPAGTTVNPGNANQCISDCPVNTTASGNQCVYSCPAGTNLISGQCYSACPVNTVINGAATSSTQCISTCPANTTTTPTQCVGNCNAGDNLISGQCYSACSAGYSINGNASTSTQCISNCGAGTTPTATQCLTNCTAGTDPISGQCYSACPAGTSPVGSTATATQCITNCPAGTTATATQCVGTCAAGTNLITGQCYSACPAGTAINGAAGSSTQCITNCPAGTTPTATQCVGTCPGGTNLISGQCYGACPAGFGIDGAVASSTQCISNCPAGTTPTATQCVGTCPAGTTLIGGQCFGNCPAGTAINPSDPTQCIANCPAGTTVNGTTCESCSLTFPNRVGSICYANCPVGTTLNPNNAAQCLSCPSGTLNAATAQCTNICPAGNNLISGQCYGACAAGSSINGAAASSTQCIANCAAGETATATQCLGTCPAGHPNLQTGTSTTCYANCSAGFSVDAGNFAQCRSDCPAGQTPVSATQCSGPCPAGTNLISGQCYGTCPAGTSIDGNASTATQCLNDCPAGTTTSGNQCVGGCPAGFPNLVNTTCYADCPAGFPTVNPLNAAQCLGACPPGSTLVSGQCQTCPANNTLLPSGQCCPNSATAGGNCPTNNNTGSSTGCVAGTYYRNYDGVAPARYFVFAPASPITNPTPAQLSAQQNDPANYVLVEINRDKPNTPQTFPKAGTRTDCTTNASTCTWDEEAQNFANWFTYYRTRLFSAVAVTSASLSNLTRDRNLDGLRLAYGSINYFPNGANPFVAGGRLPDPMTIDGQASNGALVRGVRPFTEVTPPPAPGSDDRRQEVFDWLFSLRAIASTPNRESLDSVGRYFSRADAQGPWIQPNGALPPDPVSGTTPATVSGRWSSNEDPADHISCRRNYTIMITDGEWTRAPWVPLAPQQPLVENTSTPLNALSQPGPTITGIGNQVFPDAGGTYATPEIQFSTNASSAGGTLSDIAYYYWRNDLRTDLTNNIRAINPTAGLQGNKAFWQHMVPYLIGYGISATKDTDSTRQAIVASATTQQAIDWPPVRLESRPTETDTIVTDRDVAPINCNYSAVEDLTVTPQVRPSGCGRVDDTMRAALAARGDFLSAADVGRLSQGVAAAFTAIGEIEGTATSLTGRSGTLQSGDRLFAASFRTNVWTGRVQSYDAVTYFQGLANSTTPPSIDSRFPAPASRNILTSSANGTAVVFPTGSSDINNLSAAQRGELTGTLFTATELALWLRGDQSREARNGGPFRDRPTGEIMGTIVNSQPFYSKAPDFGYQSARKPAADGSTGNAYRTFVNDNKNYRPARIYVGSNEGMLHAFDVSGTPATNSNYMNEVFAYVPRAVYNPRLQTIATSKTHQYLVDGPVVEGDVYTGGAWRTVIVGTTGAGPKGIFAIDATQRSGSTATTVGTGNVLWDIAGFDTGSNIEHLGHILQPGVIGSGKDGEWYYFVGNGYESQNDLAKLLAIRIRDGAITVVDTDSAGGSNPTATNVDQRPNGLGGVTPVYDANRNIIAIYAGDRLGRLWKFDLSSTSRSAWSSTQLFTATDPGGNRQPITAAPRIVPHPLGGRMVVFGTGRLSERNDISDLSQQTVYGVWEKNTSSPATVNKSTLRQFTLVDQVETTTNTRFRQLTGTTSLNWGTDNGWYFNLLVGTDADGERVVASPTENFGFVNITSFEPSTDGDPCQGGGRSFFYRLDVAGSFSRAPFAPTGPITNLPNTVAPNTVVGSELSTATVNQLQTLLRPATGTTNTSTSLSSADTASLANRTASAATNPCLGSQAGGQSLQGTAVSSPTLSCPVAPLRTWREIPRNPR